MINHLIVYFVVLSSLSIQPTLQFDVTSSNQPTNIENPASHAIDFIADAFHAAIKKEPALPKSKHDEEVAVHKSFQLKQVGRRIAEDVNLVSQSKGALMLGNDNCSDVGSDNRSVLTNPDELNSFTQEIIIELNSQRKQDTTAKSEPSDENKIQNEFVFEKDSDRKPSPKDNTNSNSDTEIKPVSKDPEEKKAAAKNSPKGFVRVRVKDGRISGNTSQKLYKIEGGVEVFYDDMTVNAEFADLDQNTEKVDLTGEVSVIDKEFNLKADEVHIDFKNKSMQADKFVQFGNNKENTEELREDMTRRERITTSFKNKLSKVFCSNLKYRWESGDFEASGQVKITQEGLVGSCENLKFEKEKKTYTLTDNVFLEMSDFQWLFNNKIIEEPDRKMTEVIAKQPANITAKTMIINDEAHTITLIGDDTAPAKIFQKDKYILAPKIVIDEERKLITGEQNTSIFQENADWLIEGDRIRTSDQDPETIKQLKNPLEIKGVNFKYFYEKKELELTDNVFIIGSNRKATCDKLTYNDVDSMLVLSGNVVFYIGQKEKIQSQIININTRERKFGLTGITNGFFAVDKEKSGKPELTENPGQTGTIDVGKDNSEAAKQKPKPDDDRPNIME